MKTYNTVKELTETAEFEEGSAFVCRMPFGEYRKAPGISQSQVKDFLRSPALYEARLTQSTEATTAMVLGSYFDASITGDGFEDYTVLQCDGRTAAGKAEREAAKELGLVTISADDGANVAGWVESFKSHPIYKTIAKADYQVCGFAMIDGVRVKGRADALIFDGSDLTIFDLKLVADGSPGKFAREIAEGYDIQAAMYSIIFADALKALTCTFRFLCQEKHPFKPTPKFTGDYEIVDTYLAHAKDVLRDALKSIDLFTKMGSFAGYPTETIVPRFPRGSV